jgi:hypothetical protein
VIDLKKLNTLLEKVEILYEEINFFLGLIEYGIGGLIQKEVKEENSTKN